MSSTHDEQLEREAPPRAGGCRRFCLPCCVGLLLLGVLVVVGVNHLVRRGVVTDPAARAATLESIVGASALPPGFSVLSAYDNDFFGFRFRMAVAAGEDRERLVIAAVSASSPLHPLQLRGALEGAAQETDAEGKPHSAFAKGAVDEVEDQRQITVAGQLRTLHIMRGKTKEGVPIKRCLLHLDDRRALLFVGVEARFDEAAMNAYLGKVLGGDVAPVGSGSEAAPVGSGAR